MCEVKAFHSHLLLLAALALCPDFLQAQVQPQAWAKHVETLLEVAVHTENDPKFLDWAEVYCDSLTAVESYATLAQEQRARINQTRDICGDNLNHRAPTLELFRGKPEYMGFADDAVEYALESATALLLNKPIEFQSTTLVRDGALNAVVVRGDVPIDLWEIALDALDVETNYTFRRLMGSPKSALDSLVAAVQANPDEANVLALAQRLGVARLALFGVKELDVVDDRLWMVGMEMMVWDDAKGFGDTITASGFCEDKTGSPIALNLLDVLLWSFLLLIAISGLEHIHWSNLFSLKEGHEGWSVGSLRLLAILVVPFVWIRFATQRIPKTVLFLVLPTVVAFLFIQAVGPLVPAPTTHYQEVEAKLWVIGTAIGMSLLPTALNFFVLNRFRLDGFHSMRSYRDLANVSLFGSYIPFMYIHEVNGTPLGLDFVVMLVVATWMAADLLAFHLDKFLWSKKSLRVKLTSAFGLLMGTAVIVVLTFDMIGEAALHVSLQLSLVGGIANLVSRPAMRWANRKDSAAKKATSDQSSLETGAFVTSTVPHLEGMIACIETPEFSAGYVSGPRGIGKTRLMEEVQQRLAHSNERWQLFFGDCDEVQEEGHLAFEPFVEAFGEFLSITEVEDRTAQLDAIGQSVFSKLTDAGPVPLELDAVAHDAKQSLEDFALHLIERLEKENGRMLLILDDAQWMDSDTHRLLKVFWGMITRSPKLKGRFKLLLTYRIEHEEAGERLSGEEFRTLIEEIGAEDMFSGSSFEVRDFVKGLSGLRADFTLSEKALNTLNDLFNERLKTDPKHEPQVVTPLYILRTIAHFQANKTLTQGTEGWVLTRSLSLDDLPNSEAIDAFYHNIFKTFSAKWMRVLESASIVGRSFDATVLASVWGHELLDVLDFLEQLEAQGILEDVREEDNVYRFKDKRAVAAVRSYFPNSSGDRNARQIVIEYNKRLLQAESNCVPQRAMHSDQQLWSHLDRLSQVRGVENRQSAMLLLIEELAIRFALDAKDLGATSIEKLERKSLEWGFRDVSRLLHALLSVLDEDPLKAQEVMATSAMARVEGAPHLWAYVRLRFDHEHAVQLQNGRAKMLSEADRKAIADEAIQSGQGAAWLGVVELLLSHPEASQEFKEELAEAWKTTPPSLNPAMEMSKQRMELQVTEGNHEWEWNESTSAHWSHLWRETSKIGTSRQKKIVAESIVNHLASNAEDVHGAVKWFMDNQMQLRSPTNGLQMSWVQTFLGSMMSNLYIRRVMCQEQRSTLKAWFDEIKRYLDLRMGEEAFSQPMFDLRRHHILCEQEWQDLTRQELQTQGEMLLAYVEKFPELHKSHMAMACKVVAEVSEPSKAMECLKMEHEIYTKLHRETPQTSKLDSVCARLSMLCRNHLKAYEDSLSWAQESLSWAEESRKTKPGEGVGENHYYIGAALVELGRHKEAAESFESALKEWKPDSDKMKYKIAVTHMHLGASQIKANLPEGKKTLRDAIDALESDELTSLVSPTNAQRIKDMKALLATA